MRRLFVVATAVAMLASAGAFAGEVKGPPGTVDNTNETGALDHANSACAASGLNDFDSAEGQAVSLGPLHGYGVLLRIGQMSGGALEIEQGALYPALSRLEGQALLSAEWGISDNNRRAKYYQLTAAGRKRLREETAGWQRLTAVMATALRAKLEER